jgi:hypothetical protein
MIIIPKEEFMEEARYPGVCIGNTKYNMNIINKEISKVLKLLNMEAKLFIVLYYNIIQLYYNE